MELLDEMTVRQLLLEEADRLGLRTAHSASAIPGALSDEDMTAVQRLLEQEVERRVTVTDQEAREYYEEIRDQVRGTNFETLKPQIVAFLYEQKREQALARYVEKLKSGARIEMNPTWIAVQEAKAKDNPLDRVLGKGKPVVADFGRGTCIPCKMMAPLLEELAREYQGKAHILVLDLSEPVNQRLARRYRVMAIPTQVFFDGQGKQAALHTGFMSKQEIVDKLEELGVR